MIKLKDLLSEGKYNGQIIKICLHPIFESTLNDKIIKIKPIKLLYIFLSINFLYPKNKK